MRIYGLKTSSLFLIAAIGLMTFAATAQAATELSLASRHQAILLNSGTFLPAGTKTPAFGKQVGSAILKVPAKNAEINCEKSAVTEALVENETDTKKNPEGKELTKGSTSGLSAMGQGKIEFSKCRVFAEIPIGTELKACTTEFNKNNLEFKEVGGSREATPSAKVLALTFFHFHKSTIGGELEEETTTIGRFTPLKGTLFTKLKFGGVCALPENVEVNGNVADEILKSDSVEQPLIFETASIPGKEISKKAETKLSFGANEAFFSDILVFELKGSPSPNWGAM